MPSLRDLQDAIRRSIVERDDLDAAVWIIDNGLEPGRRLSVYRNTFASTLIRAMRLSFPAVDRLVGTEFFDATVREYIALQPPHSGYLDEFGSDFADFLEQFPPAQSVPYLPDVARLEWVVSRSLHAPDAPALSAAALSAVNPADHDRLRFQPHPSVSLVQSRFPVDEIWRSVLDGDDARMALIDPDSGAVWLLVHRDETGIRVGRLKADAWYFVADMFAGCALGGALDKHLGVDAAGVLASLFVDGLCTRFSLGRVHTSEGLRR
ncbi:hypothetical protein BTM_6171 (plasmid) [Burkholderia thailandensis 34]|uniref:HvfC/BufC N-terminal domain-containing protein n=1 Tax=Burkholderia thailandensis TaxID=57975 RepID=UPI0005F1875B|nr:DNA-binding domain-containing protein [Burkholderia thailandensis]AJY27166.1 hypothetical protein BTM_6171 [Burkholderia thailandensis 34]AOJ58545.1 hypothetical protein AQ477_18115 [Burkholderia thailandensis]KXF59755.1 hypothetical protein AQ476_18200 [Burkholderia thailandensis]PNE73196.1 DUF2063 domain-containing protein [Burkholderia thailandensis]